MKIILLLNIYIYIYIYVFFNTYILNLIPYSLLHQKKISEKIMKTVKMR